MEAPGSTQHHHRPKTQRWAVKRARLLSWLTIIYLVIDAAILFLIKGNSQAMQAAWIQDLVGLIPPVVYLIGAKVSERRATKNHPYGFQQAMDLAHLAAAIALVTFGAMLAGQSAMTLINAQDPQIGSFTIFGWEIWQGWVMMAVMFIGIFPPLILGQMKMKPAELLHNKALFTDSKMNKADWLSSVATIVGVAGIGLGFWWADAVAAIIISIDILWDGFKNLGNSITSLIDAAPKNLGTSDPHPVPALVNWRLAQLPWVRETGNRTREEGQVLHVDAFVVPEDPDAVTTSDLMAAREECLDMHWKISDVSITPVTELAPVLNTQTIAPDYPEMTSASE